MKVKQLVLVALASLTIVGSAKAADVWTTAYQNVTYVDVYYDFWGTKLAYVRLDAGTGSGYDPGGCWAGGNSQVFGLVDDSANAQYSEMYSTAMSALLSGKAVRFRVSDANADCITIWGSSKVPYIKAIRID